jgi:hypothetical protein
MPGPNRGNVGWDGTERMAILFVISQDHYSFIKSVEVKMYLSVKQISNVT